MHEDATTTLGAVAHSEGIDARGGAIEVARILIGARRAEIGPAPPRRTSCAVQQEGIVRERTLRRSSEGIGDSRAGREPYALADHRDADFT